AALAGGDNNLPDLHITREIFGRSWRVTVHSQPHFIAGLNLRNPLSGFAFGGAVSVLMAAFVYAVRTSRQRSQQLLADRAHFGVILENASDAIIGESAEGIVQRWNRAAEQIFGYTAQEALGRPLTELIVPAELIAEEQNLLQKTASGQPMWLETVRRRRDGTLVDVSIAATAVADDGGRSAGVGQIMRDISEQKRMQRELSAFAEELQKQVVARTAELQAEQHFSHSILDAVPVSIA